jgi:hypothetical protein
MEYTFHVSGMSAMINAPTLSGVLVIKAKQADQIGHGVSAKWLLVKS